MTGKKSLGSPYMSMCTALDAVLLDVPKQVQETNRLHNHPDERPLQEHHKDTAYEARRPAELLSSREEVESLVRANDESEPREEEDLQRVRVSTESRDRLHHSRFPAQAMPRQRTASRRAA